MLFKFETVLVVLAAMRPGDVRSFGPQTTPALVRVRCVTDPYSNIGGCQDVSYIVTRGVHSEEKTFENAIEAAHYVSSWFL